MEGADFPHTMCCAPRQGWKQPEITQDRGTSSPDSPCRGHALLAPARKVSTPAEGMSLAQPAQYSFSSSSGALFLAEDGLEGGNRFQPYCNH